MEPPPASTCCAISCCCPISCSHTPRRAQTAPGARTAWPSRPSRPSRCRPLASTSLSTPTSELRVGWLINRALLRLTRCTMPGLPAWQRIRRIPRDVRAAACTASRAASPSPPAYQPAALLCTPRWCSSVVAAGNLTRLDISCRIGQPANALGQRCLTPAVRENFGVQVGGVSKDCQTGLTAAQRDCAHFAVAVTHGVRTGAPISLPSYTTRIPSHSCPTALACTPPPAPQFQALLRIPRFGKAYFRLTYSGFARVWVNKEAQAGGPTTAGKPRLQMMAGGDTAAQGAATGEDTAASLCALPGCARAFSRHSSPPSRHCRQVQRRLQHRWRLQQRQWCLAADAHLRGVCAARPAAHHC